MTQETGVAIISKNTNFKPKQSEETNSHFILTKGKTHQEAATILSILTQHRVLKTATAHSCPSVREPGNKLGISSQRIGDKGSKMYLVQGTMSAGSGNFMCRRIKRSPHVSPLKNQLKASQAQTFLFSTRNGGTAKENTQVMNASGHCSGQRLSKHRQQKDKMNKYDSVRLEEAHAQGNKNLTSSAGLPHRCWNYRHRMPSQAAMWEFELRP